LGTIRTLKATQIYQYKPRETLSHQYIIYTRVGFFFSFFFFFFFFFFLFADRLTDSPERSGQRQSKIRNKINQTMDKVKMQSAV